MFLNMFYRRKIIMAILQKWGGELPALDFQKILFLFTKKQINSSFDFVPYQYGCFSFQSYADMRTMVGFDMLKKEDSKWTKVDSGNYFDLLESVDKNNIDDLAKEIFHLKGYDLVKYVYRKFPYFATKSKIAAQLLTRAELKTVKDVTPKTNEVTLFTTGYEGKSFDYYLNQLIENNVKLLIDVRKNPISMKYGFSKRQLEYATKSLGIDYVHIPELGINSDKRKKLETKDDYDKLFAEYEKEILPKNKIYLEMIREKLVKYKRVALTCFEADYNFCHRGRVAKALGQLPNWKFNTEHI